MPVNDFEKQVQQKMGELQLRPSGEVWTEVEKRIRKEKQRRRFVLWFFITGVLLLGGTAWWLGTAGHGTSKTVAQHTTDRSPASPNDATGPAADKNNEVTGNNTTGNKTPGNTTGTNNDINNGTDVTQQPVSNTTDNSISDPRKPVTDPVSTTTGNNKKNNKPSINNNISSSNQNIGVAISNPPVKNRKGKGKEKIDNKIPDRVIDSPAKTDPGKTVSSPGKPTDAANQKPVNKTDIPGKTTSPSINKNNSDQPKADSVLNDSLVVKITDPVVPNNTATQPTKVKLAKESKWEFGITGGGGVSGTTDGFPLFKVNADKSLFYDSNVNPNALQGAYPAAYQLVPSDPEEGPYWQIGAYAKRKFTNRFGVSAGLQYSSFSTTQTIGKYVPINTNIGNAAYNSNVRYYYRSGDVATYRNHYNYIQAPLVLHWQINKGKKVPITWQNGVTVGRLAKSDALIYTPNSNLFYHDNSLLNKTQVSLQSGFSAKMLNKTKHPVSIGFLFNYHISHSQKVSNGRDNMASFGVNAAWILKK